MSLIHNHNLFLADKLIGGTRLHAYNPRDHNYKREFDKQKL